jgi:hypothetical protein
VVLVDRRLAPEALALVRAVEPCTIRADSGVEYLRQMRIRLSDRGLVPDLRQHFERSGFVTNRIGDEVVEVWRPGVSDETEAMRAVESHLVVWRAMHPEAEAEFAS